MARYLKSLGSFLCLLGLVGSAWCAVAVFGDTVYYDAAKAFEKYPGNVLYQTEFNQLEISLKKAKAISDISNTNPTC